MKLLCIGQSLKSVCVFLFNVQLWTCKNSCKKWCCLHNVTQPRSQIIYGIIILQIDSRNEIKMCLWLTNICCRWTVLRANSDKANNMHIWMAEKLLHDLYLKCFYSRMFIEKETICYENKDVISFLLGPGKILD